MHYRHPLLFLLFVCLPLSIWSQEICDNAIDDDGNGLIDLNDPACVCTIPASVPSFLPNPSFEDYENDEDCLSSLPSGSPESINQANCLQSWFQVSNGTTDVWNELTFSGYFANFPDSIPFPAPDGNGIVGFWVGTNYSPDPQYREYIGACIEQTPLLAGQEYTLTFDLGFIFPELDGADLTYSPSPVEIAVYGLPTCTNVFFNSSTCPENSGASQYVRLGTVSVAGEPGQWSEAEITFSVPFNIRAIAIGGSCASDILPPSNINFFGNYYLLDDLVLNETVIFEQPFVGDVEILSGSACDENLVLEASDFPDATYQWFKEGVAIVGATDQQYEVEGGAAGLGEYQVVITIDGECGISDPYEVALPEVFLSLPDTVLNCITERTALQAPGNADFYEWTYNGETYIADTYVLSGPGVIYVTATRECVSIQDSIVVVAAENLIDIEAFASDTLVCNGELVQLSGVPADNVFGFIFYPPGENPSLFPPANPFDNSIFVEVTADTTILVVGITPGECVFSSVDTINIRVVDDIQLESTITNIDCNSTTGSIEVELSQGDPNDFAIAWRDASGTIIGNDLSIDELAEGTYILSLTSLQGLDCLDRVQSYSIVTDEDGELTLDLGPDQLLCADSVLTLLPTDIVAGDFLWNTGATTPNLTIDQAGAYILSLTNNCGTIEDTILIINDLPIEFSIAGIPSVCVGDTVSLSANGNQILAYTWLDEGGAVLSETTALTTPLLQETSIRLVAANTCTSAEQVLPLIPFPLPLIEPTTEDPTCELANGSIALTITEGEAPFSVSWTNPTGTPLEPDQTTQDNLLEGSYEVAVLDNNGCANTILIELTDQGGITIETEVIPITCNGDQDGQLLVTPIAGVPPFSYSWTQNGVPLANTLPTLDALGPGQYELSILGADGCTLTADWNLEDPQLTFDLVAIDPSCNVFDDGSIAIQNLAGGVAPFQIVLNDTEVGLNDQFTNLIGGTYEIAITDANACDTTLQVELLTPEPLNISLTASTTDINLGESIRLNIQPNKTLTDGAIWTWTPAAGLSCLNCQNPELLPLESGTYRVLITDEQGCTDEASISILVDKTKVAYIPNAFSPNNDGFNDRFEVYAAPSVLEVRDVKIFDRWGSLVYEAANNDGWNGMIGSQQAPIGVYVYMIELQLLDGRVELLKGDVQIVR
ncbi:MAG: gliding motility-associated C-terminal domain-containing protein [Bacteroidota bacterium]